MSLYFAWGISLLSTFASLFFSEVLKYPPCSLCWYQRVFMYPLVIILPVGILSLDKHISKYVLSLSIFGSIIAGYHTLIYHDVIQEKLTLCTADLSCKTKQFELFGFLSIPLMSFLSFLIIFVLALKEFRSEKRT